MALVAFKKELEFNVWECLTCGMPFAFSTEFERMRRQDHKSWYCPQGHTQSWSQESETERLRRMLGDANTSKTRLAEQLAAAQQSAVNAAAQADKAEKAKARLLKRVKSGVCPCCNRTFTDLRRHMETKHKDAT